MGDIAIRAEGLGKRYRIGSRERYSTIRDTLTNLALTPFRRVTGRGGEASVHRLPTGLAGAASPDEDGWIWALDDVSFEIGHGDAVGVIGRNGAGKTTLLRILSRITAPTRGRAEIYGRVGSLLEVGTGFHPELTGRENIYLNGAIIGMQRREIDQRFDEIVSFAEVETFIDTPVKHYSSGMYVRLAFAVAAHLEPEVLLVDEVLAVGDAAFQKKCIGKMGDVARTGRTVILVSHNIIAIENLCRSAFLLDRGVLVRSGIPRDVVQEYLARVETPVTRGDFSDVRARRGSGEVRFVRAELQSRWAESTSVIRCGDGLVIRLQYRCERRVPRPVFSVGLVNSMGQLLFAVHTTDLDVDIPAIEDTGWIELEIERINLMPGRYLLHFAVGDEAQPHRYDHLIDAVELDIEPADVYGSGRLRAATWSVMYFDCRWRLFAPLEAESEAR